MLSEGWDARNVTHIMGLRAFTSQLLCEQIVGRGLRRTSYEAVGDGELFPQEYVSVFGVPFAYLLTEEYRPGDIRKPPKPLREVKVLDGRKEYALTWPEVTGIEYVMRQKLTLSLEDVPELTLNAENVPINAEMSPVLNGKTDPMMINDIDLESFYAQRRMQSIIFEAAARFYDEMREVVFPSNGTTTTHSGGDMTSASGATHTHSGGGMFPTSGTTHTNASGDMFSTSGTTHTITGGYMFSASGGTTHPNTSGDMTSASGTTTTNSGGDMTSTSGTTHLNTSGDMFSPSGTTHTITGGDMFSASGGTTHSNTNFLYDANKLNIIGQIVKLTEDYIHSGKITIAPELFETDIRRRKILLCLNMERVIKTMWQGIRSSNYEDLIPMFPQGRRERSTGDMPKWWTSREVYETRKSQINLCVCDSGYEDSAGYALDRNPNVSAWAKNDHLGFSVKYVYGGVTRKYLPDFLVRLVNGKMLILEMKGIETEQDKAKFAALCEWVRAVNSHKEYGRWECVTCTSPAALDGVIAQYC